MLKLNNITLILLLPITILLSCSSKNTIIDLQGHRGARGLYPENTWPAVKAGIDNGMNSVEIDFNLTADEHYVAHHDPVVHDGNCRAEFTSELFLNGKLFGETEVPEIKRLTLEKIKKYDCGYGNKKKFPRMKLVKHTQMLTIEEIFQRMRKYEAKKKLKKLTLLNIEIKIHTYHKLELMKAARILNRIYQEQNFADKVTIQSFNHEFLKELHDLNSSIPTIAIFGKRFIGNPELIYKIAKRINAIGINVYHKIADNNFIDDAHEKDLKVLVWTINKPRHMKKFFNAGVDGIISDYPDLLYKTYNTWFKKTNA